MKRIFVFLLSATIVSGCRPAENFINEFINGGTVHGLAKCGEINKIEGVQIEALAISCSKAVDRLIPSSDVIATARIEGINPLTFYVSVENNSNDYIMTRGIVSADYSNDDGASETTSREILFDVEPSSRGGENVYFRSDFINADGLKFCREGDSNNCLTWYLEAFGVKAR